jgi:hypothetical protein
MLGVVPMRSDRPPLVLIAIVLASAPLVLLLVRSPSFPLAVVLVPSLFLIFRVYTRDNVARWVASSLLLVLVGVNIQALWVEASAAYAATAISSVDGTSVMERTGNRTDWRSYASFVCFAGALMLLHLPTVRRWFIEDQRDA